MQVKHIECNVISESYYALPCQINADVKLTTDHVLTTVVKLRLLQLVNIILLDNYFLIIFYKKRDSVRFN